MCHSLSGAHWLSLTANSQCSTPIDIRLSFPYIYAQCWCLVFFSIHAYSGKLEPVGCKFCVIDSEWFAHKRRDRWKSIKKRVEATRVMGNFKRRRGTQRRNAT